MEDAKKDETGTPEFQKGSENQDNTPGKADNQEDKSPDTGPVTGNNENSKRVSGKEETLPVEEEKVESDKMDKEQPLAEEIPVDSRLKPDDAPAVKEEEYKPSKESPNMEENDLKEVEEKAGKEKAEESGNVLPITEEIPIETKEGTDKTKETAGEQETQTEEGLPEVEEPAMKQGIDIVEEKIEAETEKADQEKVDEVLSGIQEEEQSLVEKKEDQESAEETPLEEEPYVEPDFSTFTKEELIAFIKDAINDEDIFKHSRSVRNARKRFDEIIEAEREELKKKFIEDPEVTEDDFAPPSDPLRESMVEAYKNFQKKKKALTTQIKEEKAQNLKSKQEIIDKMKEITQSISKANRFNEFRQLQDQFRKIGPVPREYAEKLYESFRFQKDKFYDNLSMYEELKDLDRKKNYEAKEEIIKRINELQQVENVNEAINQLRHLQQEWRKAGYVPREQQDEINERYREATSAIYARKESLDVELNALRQKNFEAKTEILAKIKELASDIDSPGKNWKKSTEKLDAWIEEWKKVGSVPNELKSLLYKEFNTLIKDFNTSKNNYFKEKKKERVKHLQEKTALCERVEQIIALEDFQLHRNEVIQLQEQWRAIGSVPNKYSDKVWQRFKSACDAYFNKLSAEHSKEEEQQQENLKLKEEVIAKVEALTKEGETEKIEDHIKEIQKEWNAIGFVPFKAKDKIRERYQKALSLLMKNLKTGSKLNPEMINYRLHVENLNQSGDARKKLEHEEKSLYRELKRMENEVSTFENNMEFFRNSKGAEALKKEVEHKIEKMHERMEQIRQKLKIVKEVAYR